jgi:glycine cleavage system H protein
MYLPELKYNSEHSWLRLETDNLGRVGITQYAQEQLKDVVYVELPEIGTVVNHMEPFGIIESVKATNDLYSPVSGEVIEVNESLKDEPGRINEDPYELGWMIVIRLSIIEELNQLMSAVDYQAFISGRTGR